MLAVEAGFANWESYQRTLRSQLQQAQEHYTAWREFGNPNACFSTHAHDIAFAEERGGKIVCYSHQAMVVRHESNGGV